MERPGNLVDRPLFAPDLGGGLRLPFLADGCLVFHPGEGLMRAGERLEVLLRSGAHRVDIDAKGVNADRMKS